LRIIRESTLEIPVQVNGKLRGRITVAAAATQPEIEKAALACEAARPFLEGKVVKKTVYVPKKMVNLVV
jgi:leucyl-tRNA synthetase